MVPHPDDIIGYGTTGGIAVYCQLVFVLDLRIGLLLIAVRILRYALCRLIEANRTVIFALCQRTSHAKAELHLVNVLLLEREAILRAYERAVLLLEANSLAE